MKIVSLEGNIGTGKSLFIEYIKNRHSDKNDIAFIAEPVDKWLELKDSDDSNILEKFYNDQKRWSYSFQMNAFITRTKSIIANKAKRVVFVERSVITDRRVFAELLKESGKISELEWSLYDQWYEWLLNDYNVRPDIYVYLRASPDTSYKRMLERKRKEENGVPLDYIKSVSKKHDDWLLNEKESQVVTLSVDNDFKKDEEFRENLLKIIDSIIEVSN